MFGILGIFLGFWVAFPIGAVIFSLMGGSPVVLFGVVLFMVFGFWLFDFCGCCF
jgi:hypothetical protein